jgi:predicted MFS family arabinose efflux permease
VVGLESADGGVVGASAVPLKNAFGVDNAHVGLLLTVSTVVGALAALPAGVLVDRVSRVRVLTAAMLVWSVASAAGGLATSFDLLLATRAALGALIAFGAPAIASLLGDSFPPGERARVYSRVLCGQLAGAGAGVVASATLAGWSWRAPFLVLAVPGVVLAVAVSRLLPEPERGSQGATAAGQLDDGLAAAVRGRGIPPRPALVRPDRGALGVFGAVRYVLSVPSTAVLVLSSALAYFFLSGLETFMLEFIRGRFAVGQGTGSALVLLIGAGGLAGVLVGGWFSDYLLHRGVIAARPVLTGVAFLGCAVVMLVALQARKPAAGIGLLAVAAGFIGTSVPPLDAARLDVIVPVLWGRAEAVRTLLRSLFQSAAPVVFGVVSDSFGGREGSAEDSAGVHDGPSPSHGAALAHTFEIMLIPLVAGGLLLVFVGARTYGRDVATALAVGSRRGSAPGAPPSTGTAGPRVDSDGPGCDPLTRPRS